MIQRPNNVLFYIFFRISMILFMIIDFLLISKFSNIMLIVSMIFKNLNLRGHTISPPPPQLKLPDKIFALENIFLHD